MKKLMFAAVMSAFATMAFSADAPANQPKADEGAPAQVAEGKGKVRPQRPMRMQRPQRSTMVNEGVFSPEAIIRLAQNEKAVAEIGITPEQVAKLTELSKSGNNREALNQMQKKMREAMEKQSKLLKEKQVDEKAVMTSIDEVFEIRKEMAKAQMKKVIGMRGVLSPEQITKASEFMRSMRSPRPGVQGQRAMRKPATDGVKPAAKECGEKKCDGKACEAKATEKKPEA